MHILDPAMWEPHTLVCPFVGMHILFDSRNSPLKLYIFSDMLDLLSHFAQRGGGSSLSTHLLIGKFRCDSCIFGN